jgi:hypothetical protein
MLYKITEINEETVTFESDTETHIIPQTHIDVFAHLKLDSEVELTFNNGEVPYSISRQRRYDIREHHAEEARCGNL